MNTLKLAVATATLFAAAATAAAAATEDLVIKGLHIGMTKPEVVAMGVPYDWSQMSTAGRPDGKLTMEDKGDQGALYGLTIGGVFATHNLTILGWRRGHLSRVSFSFDHASYPLVRAAVLSKYPKMKCHDAVPALADKNGRRVTEEEAAACSTAVGNSTLFISPGLPGAEGFLLLNEVVGKEDINKAAGDI